MGKLRWYKRDPDAALGGMMVLTLEERGAYNTVLDLIYSHADQLPDDDRFIAGWCNCDVRVWRRIKARLMSLGKVFVENGLLHNFRATSGVDEALSRVNLATEAANTRWHKSQQQTQENNDLGNPSASKTHIHRARARQPEDRSKKEEDHEAHSAQQTDAKTIIFSSGMRWLVEATKSTEENIRRFLGMLISKHGELRTLNVLAAAERAKPIDPRAWMRRHILNMEASTNGAGHRDGRTAAQSQSTDPVIAGVAQALSGRRVPPR